MIKLERGKCPKELTREVREELAKLYKENKDKDVWNSPKVKAPIKQALLRMSHRKCSYCECFLDFILYGYHNKLRNRLGIIMEDCAEDNDYAAVKATNLLNDETYQDIKLFLKKQDKWSPCFQQMEEELSKITLRLV